MCAMTEAELRGWIDRLAPRLIALSTGICHDRHRAEEVVQDAFVKLWKNPPDGGERAFPSWLRRVVTNASINVLQRTKRPSALPEFGTDRAMQSRDGVRDPMHQQDDRTRLTQALERLDPMKRSILLLRGAEGLSYDEIAAHLDVPVGTVMSRLNRARLALRDVLDQMAEERDAPVFSFDAYTPRTANGG
ncbi:MAG: RNA polymerase sigma factor [Phycisphaerales bacterium]